MHTQNDKHKFFRIKFYVFFFFVYYYIEKIIFFDIIIKKKQHHNLTIFVCTKFIHC